MAKGQTYPHERIFRTDPHTGRAVTQLSSFPTTSMNLPYWYMSPNNGFTADSKTLVFRGKRSADRDAVWDILRVNVDGLDPTQLTEREGYAGVALAGESRTLYLFERGNLVALDIDSLVEYEVGHFDTDATVSWDQDYKPGEQNRFAVMTPGDNWYFLPAFDAAGQQGIVRFATDGGDVTFLPLGADWLLHSATPDGRGLMMVHNLPNGERWFKLVDYDGVEIATYGKNIFAHSSPLGRTGIHQGCAMPPHRAIVTMDVGQDEGEVLCEGPYFWHSSASLDGEWIVADTNWPNEGIQLVNVASGRFTTLIRPDNSAGHPQWTHAHPFMSPDMRWVAYNSDSTGTGQVWIIEVPDSVKDELR
jgi:oligogalacturonide lyase